MASAEDFADRRARRYFENVCSAAQAHSPARPPFHAFLRTGFFVVLTSLSSFQKKLEKKQKEFISSKNRVDCPSNLSRRIHRESLGYHVPRQRKTEKAKGPQNLQEREI